MLLVVEPVGRGSDAEGWVTVRAQRGSGAAQFLSLASYFRSPSVMAITRKPGARCTLDLPR